mgnify:CR=1 FL=1
MREDREKVRGEGEEEEGEKRKKGNEQRRGKMKWMKGSQSGMKRTPQLTFVLDESIERGLRIERLLKENEEC